MQQQHKYEKPQIMDIQLKHWIELTMLNICVFRVFNTRYLSQVKQTTVKDMLFSRSKYVLFFCRISFTLA